MSIWLTILLVILVGNVGVIIRLMISKATLKDSIVIIALVDLFVVVLFLVKHFVIDNN